MRYQIVNGTVSYADEPVLHDINFDIKNAEKVAVVGRNGCGKTTLLRLMAGELQLDEVRGVRSFIASTGNPRIGCLSQIAFSDLSVTLEEEVKSCFEPMIRRKEELEDLAWELSVHYSEDLVERYSRLQESFKEDGGYYFEKEYDVMMKSFGFSEEERKMPLRDFSGGQQTKIAFIKLLLQKPDILLLDEPTNHLDITTVEWLEGYLKSYPNAVVVVSHDRMFLDHVADVVYEIEYGTMKRYEGSYSDFVQQKQQNFEKQQKDYLLQQKEIARLSQVADRFKGKPTKASMARAKEKAIERIKPYQAPQRADERTFHANLSPLVQTGEDVLSVRDLLIGYDQPLCRISLELKRGEKLGIVGQNGLGKSTFLLTLVGQLLPMAGEFHFGSHVQIGYFDQKMAQVQGEESVLEYFWQAYPDLSQTKARSALGAFLFSGEDVQKSLSMLSGGEKVRLMLCRIFMSRPNVLILDEPTNHMDIIGKETLEKMLSDYEGTLLFVSHDRYFVKKIAGSILSFEDGGTKLYRFGYEEYQKAREERQAPRAALSGASARANLLSGSLGTSDAVFGGAISGGAAAQKRQSGIKAYVNPGKERSKLSHAVEKTEKLLEEKESALSRKKEEMQLPENVSDYEKLTALQEEIDALQKETAQLMQQWEELFGKLEELEKSTAEEKF